MKKFSLKSLVMSMVMMIAGVALSSCEHHPEHIESSWDGGMNVKDEIILDGVNSHTLNIRASVKPALTSNAEWLKIGTVNSFSTGIYTTEITAEVNATGETRVAEITVTAGKETAIIKVVQVSSDYIAITSREPEGSLDPAGGTLTIKYTATGTPAMNIPEWMSMSGGRGLEEGTLQLSYLPNDTGRQREGIIVLAVGKGATANVTVSQPARN